MKWLGKEYIMAKKIVIKIKDLKVSSDFSGFQGKDCDTLAEKIHPDGLEIEDKELKSEYSFESPEQSYVDFETEH